MPSVNISLLVLLLRFVIVSLFLSILLFFVSSANKTDNKTDRHDITEILLKWR
jgi:hypothetical protein